MRCSSPMEWCVALGDEAEATAAGADEVDLTGGFLMPSFGDGHAHPLYGGLESAGPAFGRANRWTKSFLR